MSNQVYPLAKKALLSFSSAGLSAPIDWVTDTIKVALLSANYSYSGSHQFYSDVVNDVVGIPVALTGKTSGSPNPGVADADPTIFANVSGAAVTQLVVYKDTGTAAGSPLIAFCDTVTGLPFTPVGSSITIAFDDGTARIFAL